MKVAHYIGDHAQDTTLVRLGWWLTRRGQKGPYSDVTHAEAIHAEHSDGSVTIASASLRDKGVRPKRVRLDRRNWLIVDVPAWDVALSVDLLGRTRGSRYDSRGALATMLPGSQDPERWFCNEWVGAPFLKASGTFCPAQFAAITLSLGRDVTDDFFNARQLGARL